MKNISPYKHVINSQQFDEKYIKKVFDLTDYMKKHENEVGDELAHKIVALLFYQPSTRTRFSFEAAAKLLGASTLMTESAEVFSSAAKGESLEDTIRTVNGYSDFIVLRHKENDSSERAQGVSGVPIINAGSGTGQHPTQALLDLYTIYSNFKRTSKLKIALVGDLARGRTVNSLVYLASKYKDNEFYFVSPENCKIKEGIKEHLEENKVKYKETDDLTEALKVCDVIYMTRIQKEYFDDINEYEKARGQFIINKENIKLMKKDAILMHPLPRVDEISPEVDNDPRAKYFEQARNGLNVRMAILKMLNDGE
jgi:aspartate carbamoyltransferase catalytic subunit